MKIYTTAIFLVLFCIINSISSFSQVGDGSLPLSFNDNILSKLRSDFNSIIVSSMDNDSLLTADSLYHATGEVSHEIYTFATPVQFKIDVLEQMSWDTLHDEGVIVGRIRLNALNAKSSFLMFSEFFLPKNIRLYAYNDQRQYIGGFTHENNKEYKKFSLGPIIGDHIILELVVPLWVDMRDCKINTSAYAHVYTTIFTSVVVNSNNQETFGTSTCGVNVNCPEGSGWCDQIRSATLIVTLNDYDNFQGICSGNLIANDKKDFRPLFTTAEHCVGLQLEHPVEYWIFIFNYQSEECSQPSSAPPIIHTVSGAYTRVASPTPSQPFCIDIRLLELSNLPPHGSNTYYAGWDIRQSKTESSLAVCISHPKSDIKKISTVNSSNTAVLCSKPDYIKVTWNPGSGVEPGSSGSALFHDNKRIVGIASRVEAGEGCGDAYFAQLKSLWDASSLLRNWLNPSGSSSNYLERIDGHNLCRHSYYFTQGNDLHTSANINGNSFPPPPGVATRSYNGVYRAVNNINAGGNVTIQASTSVQFYAGNITLEPGFTAEFESNFYAVPKACVRGCDGVEGERVAKGQNQRDDIVIEQSELTINIFPNPTNGNFTLRVSELYDHIDVFVYNALGENVLNKSGNLGSEIVFEAMELPQGIYSVQAIFAEKSIVITKKLIISK